MRPDRQGLGGGGVKSGTGRRGTAALKGERGSLRSGGGGSAASGTKGGKGGKDAGGHEAERLGGAPCTKGRECQTAKCVGPTGSKHCSYSTSSPRVGCRQPADPCKRAVFKAETLRRVIKPKRAKSSDP